MPAMPIAAPPRDAAVPRRRSCSRCPSSTRCSTSTRSRRSRTPTGPCCAGCSSPRRRSRCSANIRAAKRAGFKVVDVDLIPFAIVRAQPLAERGGVKLFVHVGATSTSVVVTDKGVPQFVRMLPNGGHDLTAALVDSARAPRRPRRRDEAPLRHQSDPADPQSEFVARVNAEGARDIVQAARSTVAFYENAHQDEGSRVDGVVLSGGGSQLRGLAGEIADVTGLPVTTGRGDAGIRIGSAHRRGRPAVRRRHAGGRRRPRTEERRMSSRETTGGKRPGGRGSVQPVGAAAPRAAPRRRRRRRRCRCCPSEVRDAGAALATADGSSPWSLAAVVAAGGVAVANERGERRAGAARLPRRSSR